jgi:hypothetical protein
MLMRGGYRFDLRGTMVELITSPRTLPRGTKETILGLVCDVCNFDISFEMRFALRLANQYSGVSFHTAMKITE